MSQSSEVATTGSDGAKATVPRRRQPTVTADGPPQLNDKHRLLIEYLTFGCSIPGLLVKLKRPAVIDPDTNEIIKPARNPLPGQPLTIEEAATIIGMRFRTARLLVNSPIGSKALSQALAALRNGAKAAAMHKIIALVNNEGEGKAADRKVQLEAARDILGLKDSSAAQVNITLNQQTNINPGYVVRDPRPQASVTIDGTAQEIDE